MTPKSIEIENSYAAAFNENLEKSAPATWVKALRENAFDEFTKIGFPLVTNEEWKYTNVATLAKNNFSVTSAEAILNFGDETNIVYATTISEALQNERLAKIVHENLARHVTTNHNGFTALNAAFAENGVFLLIPKNTKIESPLEFTFRSRTNEVSFPRVLVYAETGSEATIIERYEGDENSSYLMNSVVEVVVENNAHLKHFRVQTESSEAFHVNSTQANIYRDSVYDMTNINLGAKLARHDVGLKFNAENGECWVDGLYLLTDEQHTDTHSIIDHALPNCVSHQTYKGILDGKSRAVFNGKIFVRVNASGTNGYQSNKNLLLSNEARIDTKPQLEIFNDDVKCSHGATVGQLEEEELFYLLSRGLNEELARNLLTYGFAEEIINKISIESIKKQLDEAVLNRLQARLEA
ncbi:MAG: Fe-S cluster assembly protein SufD [Pyrinomonadaceae bacterium]|nr:Fe-S cluster assembly protein SufD [Pyrinomonadaceae bacterium]